ncbi:MAG: MoaD/ThiS family protein [Planctomycetota bacterium]|nr:MoaD/ThiS family protein [Planctomycetota bacterium]
MRIEIHYFASAREATRTAQESLDVPTGATVADVARTLAVRHPDLAGALPTLRFALDEAFVGPATPVAAGAVLALIPPVGGG